LETIILRVGKVLEHVLDTDQMTAL